MSALPPVRLSTPQEVRAVRALPKDAPVIVRDQISGEDHPATYGGRCDLLSCFVYMGVCGQHDRRCVSVSSVRPAGEFPNGQ